MATANNFYQENTLFIGDTSKIWLGPSDYHWPQR